MAINQKNFDNLTKEYIKKMSINDYLRIHISFFK